MPPLRPHKKSRAGCLQCKKRRVKCDEHGPPCGHCAFRKVECTYSNVTRSPRTDNSPDSSQPTPISPQTSGQTEERLSQNLTALDFSNRLLIELIHKFSTDTYKGFSLDPAETYTWQVRVPQLALNCSFLLDGLLSVTALHISLAKEPQEARSYINIAMKYQSKSLKPFQDAICKISPENCDAIFAHSIFTIVYGIALPQLTSVACTSDRTENTKILDAIVVVFELVQGTAEIRKNFGRWLNKTFPAPENFWGGSSEATEEDTSETLGRLDDMNYKENSALLDKVRVIGAAISWLRMCFQRYRRRGDPVSVISWLAMVDRRFVDFLRKHETLPILIMAHWGVLLAQLDGKVWWASNSASVLVNDALGILNGGNYVYDLEFAAAWSMCKDIILRSSR